MFTFRQPTDEQIRAYLQRQADAPFSYQALGCTRAEPPAMRGWNIDRNRLRLGHGREAFEAAKRATASWRMFPEQVARICWPDQQPQVGLVVGVLYKVWLLPLWILFPARVVWMIDEVQEGAGLGAGVNRRDHAASLVHRFGFAYGTLPDHPERGEERFVVEWNEADDTVWYDLLAVSRPAHWLAWLGYPYTRWEQARFRRRSGEAMQNAVR